MNKPTVREQFRAEYPHLTEEELDQCCENLARFVNVVRRYVAWKEANDDSPNSSTETNSTKRGKYG